MHTLTVKAPAKINLSLDITGRRADGYHFLRTVMQAITLFDTVTVSRTDQDGIAIACDRPDIPCDERNIAYRAAAAFFEQNSLPPAGIAIDIKKEIPSQAGLGGGSADGAAVLAALDRLFDCGSSPDKLRQVGLSVGADIPFCLLGGTALAEGIGEILTPIESALDYHAVICKPPVGVSTAAAYRRFDEIGAVSPPLTDSLIGAIIAGDLKAASCCMSNAFEQLLDLPEVTALKQLMAAHGALTAVMSGSGSAVYGIFDSLLRAESCLAACKTQYAEAYLCRPCAHGCIV